MYDGQIGRSFRVSVGSFFLPQISFGATDFLVVQTTNSATPRAKVVKIRRDTKKRVSSHPPSGFTIPLAGN